jgi:hypothetical protein
MELMTNALHEAQLPADAAAVLYDFFGAMATFMINREG